MAKKRKYVPEYGSVTINGIEQYRTRIKDADGKRVALYAPTREELYEKVLEAERLIEQARYRVENPTVAEYCEKWLLMQSAHIRVTTLTDYRSKVKKHIVQPLGHKYMADVTADDVKLAIIPASMHSQSLYRGVQMLYKAIFESAVESRIIEQSPCEKLSAKGGKPPKGRESLTDDQVETLLTAIKGLPPYLFVMIGLYTGLRREEILGLQWDCVYLDKKAPYLSVRRAWHIEHNRPVVTTELKTKAARRDVPIPNHLAACLREAKANSKSDYVIANRDGQPLSGTQWARLWKYIDTRTVQERKYYRYVDGVRTVTIVKPKLGETAKNCPSVVYSIDFDVTPHQLRHTYITNLIYASVDPKTVQYLAGHENSKMTMDIYAKVKYNKPEKLLSVVNTAFGQVSAASTGN